MIQKLLRESTEYLESEFYNTKFSFSYSSLTTLLYSPAMFYQVYVLGFRDNSTNKSLTEGKLIHKLLLENDFEDNYIVSPSNLPKDKTKELVDRVFKKASFDLNPELKFVDFRDEILDGLRDLNYWQNLKTEQQRIEKVDTEEVRSYWEFLKNSTGKVLIDQETYSYCIKAVETIRSNTKANELLGLDNLYPYIEVYNEIALEIDIPELPFGLKGILDNLKIDHRNKVIYINDFKTTSKSLKDFKESLEFYSYWLQATIYILMVSSKMHDLLDKGYRIEFHFIVIDKYLQVYSFPVSDKSRQDWLDRFYQVIEQATHHYETKRFGLPYEFDKELVVL